MSATVGKDAYKRIYLDAEQKVSDAVRELQSLSEELTNKADTEIVPKLRLPESWEQHAYEMSTADIYEETLRGLPDDVKVTIAYRHPAYVTGHNEYGGGSVVEVASVTVEKRCLMWTDNMLMITRIHGDMGNYAIVRNRGCSNEEREEHPKNVSSAMPEAYATLIPMRNIMAVDVAWEVNLDEMRRENQDGYEQNCQPDEMGFEELDLDEQDLESLFSDPTPVESESLPDASPERIGSVRISGQACDVLRHPNGDLFIEQGDGLSSVPIMLGDLLRLAENGQVRIGNKVATSWERHPSGCPSDTNAPANLSGTAGTASSPLPERLSLDGGEAESEDIPEWPARGAISSYNDNGTFENCFRLRSMTKARSEAKFRLPPVSEDYRSQLEPRFGKVATMTGTLVGVVRYDNCIRLVLDDMELSKGKDATEPMGHICLFVSRDYKVPATGSRLKVTGFVYAYSPSQTQGSKRQLGINAITLRTLPQP